MPKRRPKGDIKLRFSRGKEPLRFSDLRELYLQAYAWKGLPAEMQRKRLHEMQEKFLLLKGLFDRLNAGEQVNVVAASQGIPPGTLGRWWHGRHLPKIISPNYIHSSVDQRLKHLSEAGLKNPKIGYVLGVRMTGHLSSYVNKRGSVTILSSVKSGSVERELRNAQKEVFAYHMKSRNRKMDRFTAAEDKASSVQVASFLNKATLFGSHIPHKFLKEKEARKQFAMALVDSNAFPFQRKKPGRKTQTGGIRFKTKNRELKDYLSKILSEFGIKNNPRGGPILSRKGKWSEFKKDTLYLRGKVYEVFIPKTSLGKFRKEIGFRDPRKAKVLDSMISQS